MANLVKKNVIIGAGLTGLSAAYHLKDNYALYEQDSFPGGLASSEKVKGFIFDKAGHILHFQREYIKKLLDQIKNGSILNKHKRLSWVFSKNTYTRYPFQVNTYKLPPSVVKDCLVKMHQVQSDLRIKRSADNLKDWILENFGEGIARHFMFPYNKKLWKVPLKSIGIDWVDKFIPKAQFDSVVRGAISDFKKSFGYNKVFYYPKFGGIQTVSDAFFNKVRDKVYFGKKIVKIDLKRKTLVFSDGEKIKFRRIISTMPLPELIKVMKYVPAKIKAKINNLRYVSVFNLNLGIDRDNISDKHWIYFPERKYIFYRVGFFSNFSKKVCPEKKSSLYAEVSYTADKPLKYSQPELKERIIKDLNKAGILKKNETIVAEKSYNIKYAYPISDKNQSLDAIDEFLKFYDLYSIGRYGSWRYMSMEECVAEGKIIADCINSF
jgi:UDP-galactopyranose mutase